MDAACGRAGGAAGIAARVRVGDAGGVGAGNVAPTGVRSAVSDAAGSWVGSARGSAVLIGAGSSRGSACGHRRLKLTVAKDQARTCRRTHAGAPHGRACASRQRRACRPHLRPARKPSASRALDAQRSIQRGTLRALARGQRVKAHIRRTSHVGNTERFQTSTGSERWSDASCDGYADARIGPCSLHTPTARPLLCEKAAQSARASHAAEHHSSVTCVPSTTAAHGAWGTAS